jgi:8-oxo-dGTP pyrophosphatase MutT (NUDIX family)
VSNYAHQAPVEDPESVPIRHAATVMIVGDRPNLEVLMVQRTSRAVFGPSAWVFPGGRVDPNDSIDLDGVVHGMTDAQASQVLEVEANGRAWWVAGLRETLEEAGLLLGAGETPIDVVEQIRDAVHADAGAFVPALAEHGVSLDLGPIDEVARFITPSGPPRRFDTRFFVAEAPAGQVAKHDEEEVVQHRWIEPAKAIEEFRNDAFPLMSVTHRMLACLARYDTTADLMAVAAELRDQQRVRVNDPDGAYEVVLPGEPGYETAEVEIEHGWVRI